MQQMKRMARDRKGGKKWVNNKQRTNILDAPVEHKKENEIKKEVEE